MTGKAIAFAALLAVNLAALADLTRVRAKKKYAPYQAT